MRGRRMAAGTMAFVLMTETVAEVFGDGDEYDVVLAVKVAVDLVNSNDCDSDSGEW